MTDLAGKRLGQYVIIDRIGEGGMATVYRAHHEAMERDVAIKIISEKIATNPEFITRFEREVKLIAKLQHPHILPVYDYGHEGEMVYLVMRLVEGSSLDRRLAGGICQLIWS
jgi:serine/threonine protein kinase